MILKALLGRFRLAPSGDRDTIRSKVMITAYPADPVEISFAKR